MGFLVLIAFIAVPLIEIGLFVQVGGAIGLWPTLAVVVATAVAGTMLLRHQGLGTLRRLQQSMDRGEMPLGPVFDGFCLLAAGALLLTPGFFTDAVSFALFVPPVRAALGRLLARNIELRAASHVHMHGQGPRAGGHAPPGGNVIDGEWEDVTEAKPGPRLSPDRPTDRP